MDDMNSITGLTFFESSVSCTPVYFRYNKKVSVIKPRIHTRGFQLPDFSNCARITFLIMAHSQRKTPSRLRKNRIRWGFKQTDIAKKLGLESTAMISRWERGSAVPNLEYALKLSLIYQVAVNDLYHDLLMEYQNELFPDVQKK